MARKDLHILSVEDLEIIDGFNPRYDYGDIDSLAAKIKENGIKVPLRAFKVRGSKYQIVDGHRRFRAVNKLKAQGIDVSIPVISEDQNTSEEQRAVDLLLANDGKRLNQLEQSEVVNRLVEFGYNDTMIAKKTGLSNTQVANLKLLYGSSEELKTLIKEGQISSTFAISSLKAYETERELLDKVNEAIEDGKKMQEADDIAKEKDNTKSTSSNEPKIAAVTQRKLSYNSFSELKKAFRQAEREHLPVKPEMAHLHEFCEELINDKHKMEDIVPLIFDIETGSDEEESV